MPSKRPTEAPSDLYQRQINERPMEPWEIARQEARRHQDKLVMRARGAVRTAIRRGELAKLPHPDVRCVDCGKPAQQYEHRDYLRPLDVQAVCRSCNCLRGTGRRSIRA